MKTPLASFLLNSLFCGLNGLNFGFSWVKKNVRETYGGDEEVRDGDVFFVSLYINWLFFQV